MNYDTVGIERLHVQLVDSQLFWWMSIHHSFNEFIKSGTDFFSTYTGSQEKRVIFQNGKRKLQVTRNYPRNISVQKNLCEKVEYFMAKPWKHEIVKTCQFEFLNATLDFMWKKVQKSLKAFWNTSICQLRFEIYCLMWMMIFQFTWL